MELQIFKHEQFGEIRTVEVGGDPWFCLADVCKILEIGNVSMAKERLNKDGVSTTEVIDSLGRSQQATIVNESNLYKAIFQSRKPEAERFADWVTSEVLPTIRKHGAYATPDTLERMLNDPDSMIKVLTALKEEREARKALEVKAEADKPKVMFAEAVSAAAGSIGIGDMAKILKKNGVDIGRTRLFTWLRNNGYLMQSGNNTVPTQKAMDMGLFEVCETVIQSPDKEPFVRLTTKVTGKGQEYFLQRVTA